MLTEVRGAPADVIGNAIKVPSGWVVGPFGLTAKS
jgi:hypothetical protein